MHDYQPIDRTVWLNTSDPSLFPIEIDQLDLLQRTYRQYGLPEPEDFPEMEYVYGYGKASELQKFEREVIPVGLINLERALRKELKPTNKARDLSPVRREIKIIERFWEALENNQEKYAEEIEFLRLMWYYRLMGKFLFINGKVTYIPGAYWYFLNFWTLNTILPEYRDRDRRWAVGLKFCEVCTTTFKDIDEDTGLPVKNIFDRYEMIDTGKRTIFGANFPKARRVGDTSRIECWFEEFVSRKMSGKVGIQGKDDTNAAAVFSEHLIVPFIKLPIFWKPVFDSAGGIYPKNVLLLDDLEDPDFGIHGLVEFATSSDKAKFDGKYLDRLHIDEGGKMQRSDINEVVDVTKFCLSLGAGSEIHGLGASTTTTDQIEDMSAGENFMRFCHRSHFERRDMNGQTNSGYINIFFRAEDGLQGYIGEFGESIIEKPTPEQARFIGKNFGARQFINNKINEHRRSKNWDALAMFKRQHPQCFQDCFTPPVKNQIFRRDLIEAQLEKLRANPQLKPVQGDFYWKNSFGGEVGWIPGDQGRFFVSKHFMAGETNRRVMRNNTWCPAVPDQYILSADTFGIDKPTGRKSNGGIVVRWRRDIMVDPLEKELDQVESDRDVITYSFRADTVDSYCEDVLLCAIYTGAMVYVERNRDNVNSYFRRTGYEGFLLYDHDRVTGKPKSEPGFWNKNELMEVASKWLADDIVKNSTRCMHEDLLLEYLEYGGRDWLTDLDLIVCKLGTLIAERNPYYIMVKGAISSISVEGWIPGCKY